MRTSWGLRRHVGTYLPGSYCAALVTSLKKLKTAPKRAKPTPTQSTNALPLTDDCDRVKATNDAPVAWPSTPQDWWRAYPTVRIRHPYPLRIRRSTSACSSSPKGSNGGGQWCGGSQAPSQFRKDFCPRLEADEFPLSPSHCGAYPAIA